MLVALAEFWLDRQLNAARMAQATKLRPRPARKRAPVRTMIPQMEKFVKQVAERLFCCEFKKVRPAWLTNPLTGHRLELDLYNAELRTAVECAGRQHYQFVSKFHRSFKDYEDQQLRDHIKRRLCKEHGVCLIEIPWNTRRSEVEDLLWRSWRPPGAVHVQEHDSPPANAAPGCTK